MRIIIFFDLPVGTVAERKAYGRFRKFLINEGFLMMQYSVYSKLALNMTSVELIKKRIDNNLPLVGLVQILIITEKQYAGIENLLGEGKSIQIDSGDRLIVL